MTVGLAVDDFETLRTERRNLFDICRLHGSSVLWFKHPDRSWFLVQADEPRDDDSELRHLSSTASALESLALAGIPSDELSGYVDPFATQCLDAPDERWQSEKGAKIYCRVRTLPAILRLASDSVVDDKRDRILELLKYVWDRVDLKDQQWLAVSEEPDDTADNSGGGYPPNAFHTYWAIRCLDNFEERFGSDTLPDELITKRVVGALWTERTLGMQATLIAAKADPVDASQLGWALAAQFQKSPEPPLTRESAHLELYRAALAAFFSEQLPSGGWRLYRPLFHYPEAGNAYCYTFETLTEILRPALHTTNGKVLRDLLRPYANDLIKAWHFARDTQIDLGKPGCYGWCSGHHPHRTAAEGWATASVFSFLQVLRRLVACWTQDAAAASLGVRLPRWPSQTEARSVLAERGDTWTNPDDSSKWTVNRRIAAMFINPIRADYVERVELDPDQSLLGELQARSAVLYGPPGTSKTTIVEALAGAIGWNFLEIQASDFLADGMDQVPSRADVIFTQVMELDHCVVFFDEIDELLRDRTGTSDPFGRFLTTSMLPKLAKLWSQGRVLFFVATNDIANADPAIIRSQRFDAVLFAAPPSFHRKVTLFRELSGSEPPEGFTWDAVQKALVSKFKETPGETMSGDSLGVFALLRHDQLLELTVRVTAHDSSSPIDALRSALKEMGDDLCEREWHRISDDKKPIDLYDALRDVQAREEARLSNVSASENARHD